MVIWIMMMMVTMVKMMMVMIKLHYPKFRDLLPRHLKITFIIVVKD